MKGDKFKVLEGGIDADPRQYHYAECGLKDVYLMNGFEIKTHDEDEYVFIHNVEDLHWAIGRHLVTRHSERLNGSELRFLRKTMDLTQVQLAAEFGKKEQTVARWEKGEVRVPVSEEKLLRAIFLAMAKSEDDAAMIRSSLLSKFGTDKFDGCKVLFQFSDSNSWSEPKMEAVF